MTSPKASQNGGLSRILVLATVTFLAGCTPPKPAPIRAISLDQSALSLVSFLVVDDIHEGVQGNEALMSQPGLLLPLLRIDQETEAKAYEAAYDSNEIAADNQFRDKRLLLHGTVKSIEKDFTDRGYIILNGSGLIGIHAALNSRGMAGAGVLRKGQKIGLVCVGAGRVMRLATARDCETFDDYVSTMAPSLSLTIENFLEGQVPLPRKTGEIVVSMYQLAKLFPPGSQCVLNHDNADCGNLLTALSHDPKNLQTLEGKSKEMLSKVKLK